MDTAQITASIRGRSALPTRATTIEAVYATAHWLLARERAADAARVFRVMLGIAPRDERGWLGLGECHERIGQQRIAAELYGAGSVAAGGVHPVSVRCLVARARALAKLDRAADVETALDAAARAAQQQGDADLVALVESECRRLS